MILSIPFKHFSSLLQGTCNSPLALEDLLRPFRLQDTAKASPYLLVGHLIDELSQRFQPEDSVDALEVASAAWDLGYDEAGEFLERGPYIIYQLVKEEGLLRL